MKNKHFKTDDILESFVREIKKYPTIWDQTKTTYRRRDVKHDAWAKVSQAIGNIDIEECKFQWKLLKEKYKREKKKFDMHVYGDCSQPLPKLWSLLPVMEFIEPHICIRPINSKFGATSPTYDDFLREIFPTSSAENKNDELNLQKSVINNSAAEMGKRLAVKRPTDAPKVKKRKNKSSEDGKASYDIHNSRKSFNNSNMRENANEVEEEDPATLFARSLGEDLKKLPRLVRLQTQTEIMQLMIKKVEETIKN